MDDRELETMFAEAPGEPPPPTFGAADVIATSRKAQARRRSMITVTCGVAALALAGAGVFGLVANPDLTGPSGTDSAVNAPVVTRSSVSGQPGGTAERPPNAEGKQGFPTLSPMQGGDESGKNGPRAESASGCDKVDRELATALAGELPVPVVAADASPGRVCTPGSRSAAFPVGGGTISVSLLPAGVSVRLAEQPPGVVEVERLTAGGTILLLFSAPADGSTVTPLAGDVGRIADQVAARF